MKRAFPPTSIAGQLRQNPEDFRVDEWLGFEPDGCGEFLYLQIEKTGANTDWVARTLAQRLGLSRREVSHSGLKDRHAVTVQWLSVHLPGKPNPDLSEIAIEGVRFLRAERHGKKLRIGTHRANRFAIRLSEFKDPERQLTDRCELIRQYGFPNYFGPQRFGRDGKNVEMAEKMVLGGARVRDRSRRSLMLSVARARIFNHWLADRVQAETWRLPQQHDYVMLNGTRSFFGPLDDPEAEAERALALDLHVAGPLAGKPGRSAEWTSSESLLRETHDAWIKGLEKLGAKLDRRAARVAVPDLEVDDKLSPTLRFTLPRGAYATALFSEIGAIVDAKSER